MHYHLEVIMPKTKDIEGAIEKIMTPFNENSENEDHEGNEKFWDWYIIGGRFAGRKETCQYPEEKLSKFYNLLNENKVTVASVVCGKQTISPASQIPLVDQLWNDIFPTETGEIVPCPLFSHSNNQYENIDIISCDICLVEEIPAQLRSERIIIAHEAHGEIEAEYMISASIWNGLNFVKTWWDGYVLSALEDYNKKLENYSADFRELAIPKNDWLCVTVDYHS